MREHETELKKIVDLATREKEELTRQLRSAEDESQKRSNQDEEVERLTRLLKTESVLKQQAVNKLAEIMNRKDMHPGKTKNKVSSADLKRREKDCRKLQLELTQVLI